MFVLRLVSALPRENRSVALDLASTVDDERTKALLLDICAPALKISEVREALAIARSLGDFAERLHVLRGWPCTRRSSQEIGGKSSTRLSPARKRRLACCGWR